jgi:hypothetical protein
MAIQEAKKWGPTVNEKAPIYTNLKAINSDKLYTTSTDWLNDTVTTNLTAENNIWCVLTDMKDEMEDAIPLLVTRNIDIKSLIKNGQWGSHGKIKFSTTYNTPFGKKGYVVVRKGGAIYKGNEKYIHLVGFGDAPFRTPPPVVYLQP